ncbi:MAG: hypothetical protein UY50_C0029G0007 [Parcubacteria group bacterium GW2011_GWA2_49_9]|nr:MAG: hypothetical protein UY50_C0029G0007 [Parcubacteria group bacterium GW2011_GWA2_49_9]
MLLSVFFTPLLAAAQTPAPYARYCPDPTQIFTGIAYDSSGKPRIELLVEHAFEEKMQKERGLGSLPLTPVYDLVVRVVPTINEYCLPQYDEKGTLIQRVDPPGTLPFTVYFALGNETLLGGTAIHYARQESEDGFPYYEWEVKGWPKGIFISEKLEKVITAVQDNDPTLRIAREECWNEYPYFDWRCGTIPHRRF